MLKGSMAVVLQTRVRVRVLWRQLLVTADRRCLFVQQRTVPGIGLSIMATYARYAPRAATAIACLSTARKSS